MIRIQVPATSANLGSGFDALGIALSLHNQVWMEESDKVEISCKDNIVVPTDERNLIFSTARTLYEACGKSLKGLKIIQQNDMEQKLRAIRTMLLRHWRGAWLLPPWRMGRYTASVCHFLFLRLN